MLGDEPPLVVQLNEGVQFHKQHSSSLPAARCLGHSVLRHRGFRTASKNSTQAGPPSEKTDSNSDAVAVATGEAKGIPVDLPIESNDGDCFLRCDTYFGLPRILAGNEKLIFDVRLKNHPHSTTVLQESEQMGPTRHSDHALVAMPLPVHLRDVLLVDELVISSTPSRGLRC